MSKTKIINLLGGPGCGKSTFSGLIYAELKLKGKTVEYVQEFAKNLVWLKEFETLNNQHYVSQCQYKLLKSINDTNEIDYIVTDGSLLHGLYYNRYNTENLSNVEKTEKLILKYYSEFKNINIFLKRGKFEYEQAGRIQNLEEAREIDYALKKILDELKIEYIEMDSDKSKLPEILEYIINM